MFRGGPGVDTITLSAPRQWRGTGAEVLTGTPGRNALGVHSFDGGRDTAWGRGGRDLFASIEHRRQ